MERSERSIQIEKLLARIHEDDDAAQEELIQQVQDRLVRLCRKMLHGYTRLRRWEQTDDVFQAAALRLHRSLSQVRPETSREFFGLAATQIRRTLLDLCRHHFGPAGAARHHHTDYVASSGTPADFRRRPVRSGHSQNGDELWSEFHEAVNSLPEDEREVFSMSWYLGLTHREIAESLDVSERTVIRRNNRARLKLRAVWQES